MSRELTYHDLKEEQELADKLIELDKAIKHISNEFLCYDNESDEYIEGLKTIKILNGSDN